MLQTTKALGNGGGPAYAPAIDMGYFGNAADTTRTEDEAVLITPVADPGGSSLPSLATAQDVREIVRYLHRNKAGVSVIEAMNAEPKRVFDARKIAAYEFWGVVERVDGMIRLSELGRDLAQTLEPEKHIHRQIIRSIPAYREVIEWVRDRKMKIITHLDVLQIWQARNEGLQRENHDKLNESVVVSFFSICHAADLGLARVGKRGQPARFCVAPDEWNRFLDEPDEENGSAYRSVTKMRPTTTAAELHEPQEGRRLTRIYVSGAGDTTQNLRYALEIADFETSTYEGHLCESQIWPPARVASMQGCQAAVFLLDSDDCAIDSNRKPVFNSRRVTEINVALALFEGRVVFLWKGMTGNPIESDERRFHFFFAVDDSSGWKIGLEIVRLLKHWRVPDGESRVN